MWCLLFAGALVGACSERLDLIDVTYHSVPVWFQTSSDRTVGHFLTSFWFHMECEINHVILRMMRG